MDKRNKKIFWIASYPKSGNTWMRAIISSLFFTKDGLFDFNFFKHITNFDIEENYKFIKSLNYNDYKKLNDIRIISKYWIEAQKRFKTSKNDFSFFKTHNANIKIGDFKYTNENYTLGLIYLVRDPRDIAISFSHHKGVSVKKAITLMQDEKCMSSTKYPNAISSWDRHYSSWKNFSIPKILIKYENLLHNTEDTIRTIITFFKTNFSIDLEDTEKKIKNIVNSTSFKRFQECEKKFGFNEATKHSIFFRKGENLQWKKILTKSQVKTIESSFESTMKETNYLL